jgi:hypothetical protein
METTVKKILQEIEEMYIVELSGGTIIPTGSFIATGTNGKEYFSNEDYVKRKHDFFNILETKKKNLWALITDEIWDGKWNNRHVSRIVFLSDNRLLCENYKERLVQHLQLLREIMIKNEQHIKLIRDSFNEKEFKENEERIIQEVAALQNKLARLNAEIELYN